MDLITFSRLPHAFSIYEECLFLLANTELSDHFQIPYYWYLTPGFHPSLH